jgi:hypothetical protein
MMLRHPRVAMLVDGFARLFLRLQTEGAAKRK